MEPDMPAANTGIPALAVPDNCRETILSKKEMFLLNMRLSVTQLAFSVICALYCVFFSVIFLYGQHEPYYIDGSEYAAIIIGVSLFYTVLILLSLAYLNFRKMNMYGIPLLMGFTNDVFYTGSVFGQSVDRWEYYTARKETKKCFLLMAQGRWFVLPKAIWSGDELEELRGIMREKIGQPLGPSTGRSLK